MIVQLRGTHLSLTDDRFSLVMDELEDCLRALKRLGAPPLQVDVALEKTVQRAPQTRRGDRRYRTSVAVAISGQSFHAEGTDDVLSRALGRMAAALAREIRAWNEQRAGEPERGVRSARASAADAPVPVPSPDAPAAES